MVTIDQIRMRLAAWIDGKITLAEFEDWFVPSTWNLQGSEELVGLVDEIELNLSEYSGGYLSRQQLRAAMTSALAQVPSVKIIVWNPEPRLMPVRSRVMNQQGLSFLQFARV